MLKYVSQNMWNSVFGNLHVALLKSIKICQIKHCYMLIKNMYKNAVTIYNITIHITAYRPASRIYKRKGNII